MDFGRSPLAMGRSREAREEASIIVLVRNFSHGMKIRVCHSHENWHF